MSRARELLTVLVILMGAGLMIRGEQLWMWATHRPVGADALVDAVAVGDVRTVRRALAAGASIEERTMGGFTLLALAASGGDEVMVACLIGNGADVDALSNYRGTALAHAALTCGDVDVMRVLLDADAKVDGPPDAKLSPLVGAVSKQHEAAVALLLERGANPNLAKAGDFSPLTAALDAEEPHEAIIRRLIEAGADVNQVDGHGVRPLKVAKTRGHTAIAQALTDAGAAS